MNNPFYYLHVWFSRHLLGFCPECNSSSPKMYGCPVCHHDRTAPFDKKKSHSYWLRWRVLHGYTHVHYTKEERAFIMSILLDTPVEQHYYNFNQL